MPDYGNDRIDDLKDTMTSRFDDTNARLADIQATLSGLETKDHASAEWRHVNSRVDDLKDQIDDSKKDLESFRGQIYRTVTLITGILSMVVSIASNLLPSLH